MRRVAIAAASILLTLSFAAPIQATGEGDLQGRLVGRVTWVDQGMRTMRIGDKTYHVPPDVAGFEALERRDVVEIRWEIENSQRTVTAIRHFPDRR